MEGEWLEMKLGSDLEGDWDDYWGDDENYELEAILFSGLMFFFGSEEFFTDFFLKNTKSKDHMQINIKKKKKR